MPQAGGGGKGGVGGGGGGGGKGAAVGGGDKPGGGGGGGDGPNADVNIVAEVSMVQVGYLLVGTSRYLGTFVCIRRILCIDIQEECRVSG